MTAYMNSYSGRLETLLYHNKIVVLVYRGARECRGKTNPEAQTAAAECLLRR